MFKIYLNLNVNMCFYLNLLKNLLYHNKNRLLFDNDYEPTISVLPR